MPTSSPWGIDPLLFLGLYLVAVGVCFCLPFLVLGGYRVRRAGARLAASQLQQPDPELIGFVLNGRRGALAAAFASLQARGRLDGLGTSPPGLTGAGTSALQEAVLAESTPGELAGPFPGSGVSAALRDIESRALGAGLLRAEGSHR